MDGLYACGPAIKTCREYGWDYMLVFKEGSMRDAWREAMGLISLTPENILKRHCGGRNQAYRRKIENNFLVMKHQGYRYEHCFS